MGGSAAADTANAPTVWLHTANARVTQWQRTQQGQRTDFTLQGHVPLQFSVAGMAPACKLSANGQPVVAAKPSSNLRTDVRTYKLADASAQIQVICAGR